VTAPFYFQFHFNCNAFYYEPAISNGSSPGISYCCLGRGGVGEGRGKEKGLSDMYTKIFMRLMRAFSSQASFDLGKRELSHKFQLMEISLVPVPLNVQIRSQGQIHCFLAVARDMPGLYYFN
jgi:hypothetical protein